MVSAAGWTIEETAKALGVSEKTVRRRIKDGTIKADQILGKYGPEYRISEAQIASLRDRAAMVLLDDQQDTVPPVDAPLAPGRSAGGGIPLDGALDMIRDLQSENERLAGQIGFLQAKLMDAEGKLRLLASSRPHVPWWHRLFPWTKSRARRPQPE